MSLISRLVREKKIERTPVWLMRQAGRYMSVYREVRSKAKDFLEMCYSPNIAAEITMQPINKFGFDAAIIFSDILVIPDALGVNVEFIKNKGPILSGFSLDSSEDVNSFLNAEIGNKLDPVYEAIKLVRKKLDKEKDLIGFSGAPWTLFSYIAEGGGSKSFDKANACLIKNKDVSRGVIKKLTTSVAKHLINQIEAGANVVQIFDSWAGEISVDKYKEFVINPAKEIVETIRKSHKDIPIICFPRGSNFRYKEYVEEVKPDILGIDQELPLEWAKQNLANKAIIQGNLDPMLLLEEKQKLGEEAKKIIKEFGKGKFIFNLGRGVYKETPEENVEFLVNVVKGE